MQVKKHRDSDRSGGDMRDGLRKAPTCFSNIKIFLISECALMLAQGTVGAYLVSPAHPELPPGLSAADRSNWTDSSSGLRLLGTF